MGLPRLLMLDEPSLGLAPRLVTEMFDTLRVLREEGLTVLLVEQNMHQALELADVGYVLETGRVVLAGPSAIYSPIHGAERLSRACGAANRRVPYTPRD